jgi:diacylglycerol kinase family enzyme
MSKEKAIIIIHPKAQHHVADVLPILEERWETKEQVTAYAGHGIAMAVNALQQGYHWIISFGGDGTLNEVMNGAMQAQQPCTIGVLPGGTVNQWVHEIGLPAYPVEAARVLTESSTPRRIDVGFIGVQALTIANTLYPQCETESISNARQHFLIVAGLGIDATTIQTTTEASKQHYGQLAFLIDWVQLLPNVRPFPAQISWSNHQSWQGQAFDILVSNTRRYANVTNMIPKAHVNDGLLEIRIVSLFSHKPGLLFPFQDSAFSIRLPASIALELDGSAVSLADYLNSENQEHLLKADELSKVMVTYAFVVKPAALLMAVPTAYRGELFIGSSEANG